MKKIMKLTGAVIAIIVLLMITVPYFFRDKIEELVKTEGNKMLNAEFDFGNLDISLIRNFPQKIWQPCRRSAVRNGSFPVKRSGKIILMTNFPGPAAVRMFW